MIADPQRNGKQSAFGGGFDVKPYLKADAVAAPIFTSQLGTLFAADNMTVLPCIANEVIDTVFADPQFNLGKEYSASTDDRLPDEEYLDRCHRWLAECVRVLKPGGSLFVYNLPRWNVLLGAHLMTTLGLDFRHWIAMDKSASLSIAGRLYPSHYSLLYFSKGKPKTFHRLRTPIQTCRHCGGEIKDYGGHRGALNPDGITLKDVWTDIPPVRHWKFKSRNRKANALSTKLLDRVVDMSTNESDLVLDPFGGSGTTFDVCERKKRRWIGIEINAGYTLDIIERLTGDEIHPHKNDDCVAPVEGSIATPRRGRAR
jgi:site-specific DNA-methyltransferase (adenine-specific)